MSSLLRTGHSKAGLDFALLLMRVAVGLLMWTHGLPKFQALLAGTGLFPSIFGLGSGLSHFMAVFAEVVCSLFVLVGLATRVAVLPIMVTMLVAVFHIHSSDPFSDQEPGILYLVIYTVLLILGSGKYSLDYVFQKKRG